LVDVTEVAVAFPMVTPWRDVSPETERPVAVTPFKEEDPPTLNAPAIVEEPETKREEPVPLVKDTACSEVVPVAVNPPTSAVANVPFVPWTVEANRVDPVAFVKVRLCSEAVPVAVRFPTVEARAYREFAKRLVVVTEVEVTFARTAFQRREADPKESAASSVGMREVETPPSTARPVVVTLEPWAFAKEMDWKEEEPRTVRVEVTVEEAATNPPKSWRVEVAEEPRAVTWAKVSALDAGGQLVPSAKHGRRPLT
jgi:hypothetical protein